MVPKKEGYLDSQTFPWKWHYVSGIPQPKVVLLGSLFLGSGPQSPIFWNPKLLGTFVESAPFQVHWIGANIFDRKCEQINGEMRRSLKLGTKFSLKCIFGQEINFLLWKVSDFEESSTPFRPWPSNNIYFLLLRKYSSEFLRRKWKHKYSSLHFLDVHKGETTRPPMLGTQLDICVTTKLWCNLSRS